MAYPQFPHATYNQWRNAVNGQFVDIDGQFGAQCWDGVCALYVQNGIGQYLYTAYNVGQGDGTAKSCWLNDTARGLNGSGHFRIITDQTSIKKGDIIVFNTYSGWYGSSGHIGFADEDYNGTNYINILSENYGQGSNPTTGKAFNIAKAYLGEAFLGVFRYDGWNQPSPPPPPQQDEKKKKFPFPIAWKYWWDLT